MRLGRFLSTGLGALIAQFGATQEAYAPPRRSAPKVENGAGARRAAKRLAAKRKANKAIPSGAYMTRQQRRAEERADAKARRVTPAEQARRNRSRA